LHPPWGKKLLSEGVENLHAVQVPPIASGNLKKKGKEKQLRLWCRKAEASIIAPLPPSGKNHENNPKAVLEDNPTENKTSMQD